MTSRIPEVTRENVLAAVAEIARDGIPTRSAPTKFALVVGRKKYPPKYVLSLAVKYATGEALSLKAFSGGEETNRRLRALGFQVATIEHVEV
jgi:5-methylcytosine-specific restriction protein B